MGPYATKRDPIKTGQRHVPQDHFQTHPDPNIVYTTKRSKLSKALIRKMLICCLGMLVYMTALKHGSSMLSGPKQVQFVCDLFFGPWKILFEIAPNGASRICFLVMQTLHTFWAERIWILKICIVDISMPYGSCCPP